MQQTNLLSLLKSVMKPKDQDPKWLLLKTPLDPLTSEKQLCLPMVYIVSLHVSPFLVGLVLYTRDHTPECLCPCSMKAERTGNPGPRLLYKQSTSIKVSMHHRATSQLLGHPVLKANREF